MNEIPNPAVTDNTKQKKKSRSVMKGIIIFLALIIYTGLVICTTVFIDREIIKNEIKNGFQQAFGGEEDTTEAPNFFDGINNIFDNTENTAEEAEIPPKSLYIGQTATIGNVMEFTPESSEWTEEIKPSNTSGTYNYYSDNVGEKYFVIRGKVKNLAGETLDISNVNESELIINDTYKAKIRIESEESDGSSFYGNIKPLQTLNFVAYASVSDEVYNICENIKVTFNLLSDASRVGYFFDMSDAHETYVIEFSNTQ